MMKIENENTKVYGFDDAIRGMRNAMNSWEKSDSCFLHDPEGGSFYKITGKLCGSDDLNRAFGREFDYYREKDLPDYILGPNDKKLMQQLAAAGKDHAKYRRMIIVWFDMTAPFYWWKEFDTYKIGTVANSCSTMHNITEKEFVRDDFSWEHLFSFMDEDELEFESYCTAPFIKEDGSVVEYAKYPVDILDDTIFALNFYREKYLKTKDKRYWWQLIQLLPSSYNQRRTVMLNYEVLANIYPARKAHKLDEWHTFCDWIRELPESWIITGEENDGHFTHDLS